MGLLELAEQIVTEQAGSRAASPILQEMLSRSGLAEAVTVPGTGRLPSVAEIFDAFAYPGREGQRAQLEQHFEVVALPRTALGQDLREGDLLIRRAEGDCAHLSVIAASELRSHERVLAEGLVPEAFVAGEYAQVVDAGARPHTLAHRFARRVTDSAGRMPYDSLVLRVRQPAALVEAGQSAERGQPDIEAVSEICAGDISEFGRAWRASHDVRRRPRPQWVGGRPLCAGQFDFRRTGIGRDTVDLLLFNFDIDGSYPKVQHESALDTLISMLRDYLARNPPGDAEAIAYEVHLQGYADRTGSAAYNEVLANEREAAVESYLRANLDRGPLAPQALLGPLVRYLRMKGGFAPDALPGRNTPHARAVLVWAVPVGSPKPPPRPVPTPSTVFDELTELVRPVSMGLTADSSKVLAPPVSAGTAFTASLSDPEGWKGSLVIDGDGAVASGITFPIEMTHGGTSHVMPATVFDSLAWKRLTISDAAFTGSLDIVLPLTNRHILASAQASGRRLPIAAGASNNFPLATEVQTYVTVVFGYNVDGQSGVVDPLDISQVPPGQLLQFLKNHGNLGSVSTSKAAVLAAYDLVLTSPKDDYQPKDPSPMGPAEVARSYPLLSVWSSRPLASVSGVLDMKRPARTAMEGMARGGAITNGLYTDMNANVQTLWDCLSPQVKLALLGGPVPPGLLPGGISIGPAVIAALRAVPCTRWDSLFAHYKLDAVLSNITVVAPGAGRRTNATARQVWDLASSAYVTSSAPVLKVERQGMFDNIHLAPAMDYKGAAAFMAPLCHHDCLHIHWRWGESFPDLPLRGWLGGRPYQKAGAPMIPENQSLKLSVSGPALSYLPTAANAPAQSWQIFMHHGTGYVTKLTVVGRLAPMLDLVQLGTLPDFNAFYYHNRLWEIGATRAADKPRLNEAAFGPLETL